MTAVSIGMRIKDKSAFEIKTFVEKTEVYFSNLSNDSIEEYIKSGEPFDKAGGYGIQSQGGTFVEKINGCYFNVVGFPSHRFCIELLKLLPSEYFNNYK